MKLPWLESFETDWQSRLARGRVPHAVLLQGTFGVGKRCAACWMVAQKLGLAQAGGGPVYPAERPVHPDLRWITPAEDKFTIGIEAIRELVAELSLTSYSGGGKVAVIDPASAMTLNAANSLLKTLEEPPGDALLVLIADKPGRLPATILSRCQRISLPVPTEQASLDWLNRVHPGQDWGRALHMAGNAPLAAMAAMELLELASEMERDFVALPQNQASPLEVAARWSKQEPGMILGWMGSQVRQCIRQRIATGGFARPSIIPDSVLRHMDTRKLFCYLDTVDRVRNQPAGSFNVQLTLESLLIDWSDRLQHFSGPGEFAGRSLLIATRL